MIYNASPLLSYVKRSCVVELEIGVAKRLILAVCGRSSRLAEEDGEVLSSAKHRQSMVDTSPFASP